MYMKGMEQSPTGAAVMKTSTQERGSQLGAEGVRPVLPVVQLGFLCQLLWSQLEITENKQRHSHYCRRCDQNHLPSEIFHNGQKQQRAEQVDPT